MKKIKFFFYKFFYLKYGKIKGIRKASNINDILIKEALLKRNIKKKIYILKNSRLYTDRIHNLALINRNFLIQGPSYQIINTNYASCKKNIVLKIGTPRLIKKIKGKVLSLLSGGGANANYFHWLYDVLPRLKIVETKLSLKQINYLLLPSVKKKFQRETLRLLGFKNNQFLPSEKYRHIQSSEIVVSDHPWVNTGNSTRDELNIANWIYDWLKLKFLSKIKKKISNNLPKKIFILRKNNFNKNSKNLRFLKNKREIFKILKDKRFKFIDLEKYSFLKQVEIFNNAKTIMGVHGAGFANIVFCKKNTKIFELKNKETGNLYRNIAIKNGLKYQCLISRIKSFNKSQNGIIDIDIDRLKKLI